MNQSMAALARFSPLVLPTCHTRGGRGETATTPDPLRYASPFLSLSSFSLPRLLLIILTRCPSRAEQPGGQARERGRVNEQSEEGACARRAPHSNGRRFLSTVERIHSNTSPTECPQPTSSESKGREGGRDFTTGNALLSGSVSETDRHPVQRPSEIYRPGFMRRLLGLLKSGSAAWAAALS